MYMIYSKVNWKQYLDSSNPTINRYLNEFGNEFIVQTTHRIELAHKSKKPQIILFRFRDADIVSILESKDYLLALECLLKMCIKLEKYELCQSIKNAIHSVKIKKRINLTANEGVLV